MDQKFALLLLINLYVFIGCDDSSTSNKNVSLVIESNQTNPNTTDQLMINPVIDINNLISDIKIAFEKINKKIT